MRFDLLWPHGNDSVSIIEDNAFDDLELFTLFNSVIDYNYNFLMPTIKQIPSYQTIFFRQAIINDFLNDQVQTFERLKEILDNLIGLYNKYLEGKNIFYKTVNFLLFIESYLNFVEEATLIVNSQEFTSHELNRFKKFLNDEGSSKSFALLKADFMIAYSHFEKIRNFSIYNEPKAIRVSNLSGKIKIEDRLLELANQLKLEINIYKGGGKKDKLSSQFLEAIVILYQEDYEYLTKFYYQYQNITFELENLSYEIAYYLFFKTFLEKVSSHHIPLNKVSLNSDGIITFRDVYDITLINNTDDIIPNDVMLSDSHHIELITGVNSGGKTSYIRSIGVNYILTLMTGYAFCQEANIYPIKHLQTHFPNDENFKIGFGRLNDELARLDKMSETFSKDALIILNETFSSTDENTAFKYTELYLSKLHETKTFCLYVTHQQKIFDCNLPSSVRILSPMIDLSNNNKRLYKLKIVTDKTSSYTYDILYKYGLTKDQLNKRLGGK